MGLYKRKGSQFYWMTYKLDGRKLFESTRTQNRKLAEKIYAKWVTDILEGKWFERKTVKDVTMSEVLDRYMSEISPSLSATTHARNEQIMSTFKASLGSLMVKDVTPSVISRFKADRIKEDYSRETVLRELGLLRRIFNIAIEEWELCKENPVRKVLKTLGKIDTKRVRYLSPEELRNLYVVLPSWLRPIVTIARHTGLRRGNILELTWEQVNIQRKVLVISRTKNGDPIGIPLTETALMTLADLQKIRHLHSSYVFCDKEGKPYSPNMVSVAFKRACKRAEINNCRFHDLRHDFASNLIQAGVDIYTIKELLGHKDLRMTVRYSHLAPENLRSAVSVLDEKEKGYNWVTVGKKKRVANDATL